MFNTLRNDLEQLTNDERKALLQCLLLGIRPPDILLRTSYAIEEPDGEISLLGKRASDDYSDLLQRGKDIDSLTGALVELRRSPTPARTELLTSPFTPNQERRIREIVAEEIRGYAQGILDYLS